MKRIVFLFGIVLLALAFLVTGAELAARTILGTHNTDVVMSTRVVWRTVAPHSFLLLHKSALWPFAQHLLIFPGWLLFGAPGLALAISFRPQDADDATAQQNKDHEESLYLYDELALAAQKEGYDGLQDDRYPSNPADIIPAEDHYAEDLVEDELASEHDFLLGPTKPSQQSD
ncbi:hypothetical protein [Magnetovibrio sp.]|uniref:hypothetical protein n=1 Tax=Magnetovibrio sp. TaxID=2024836 RepID=UPI002F93F094